MALWSKVRGTIETLFQLGLGGPNWKASSGAIEGRDAADAAYAIVRGATPVGLDDLLTKRTTRTIGALAATRATVSTTATAILVLAIPANSVAVGDVIRIQCFGISSSTGTLIFRVYVGANGVAAGGVPTDTEAWRSITSAAQVANQRAGFTALLVVRSIGAGGTVQCEGLGYAQAANLPTLVAAVTTPAVATNAQWFVTIACTCSVGTWTAQSAFIL